MTTLNTIIEEEKKKASKQSTYPANCMGGDVLELDRVKKLLSTAMQRAYEAGIDRVAESIDEIANGKYANAIYSWTPHDYMLHLDQLKKEIKG